jgi:hypothetical protein
VLLRQQGNPEISGIPIAAGQPGERAVPTQANKLEEVTRRLERAEDDLWGLVERHPHLLMEPVTLKIMDGMRSAIMDLRLEARPS